MRAALRAAGVASLDDVAAVVLETDGTFSVVRGGEGERGSLHDLVPLSG
ncbi:MAG TPA: YetF domain-containing protein [Longimicrobiaceae bacterium]|nr:YetF domain-containing protein [Longimicrobiaceae bacterium]